MASYNLAELFAKVEQEIKDVPDGSYSTEIVDANVTATQAGKPMLNLTHRVTSGSMAGASVVQRQVLSPESPQALQIFFRSLKSLGVPEAAYKGGKSLEEIAKSLIGKKCAVTVKTDDYGPKVSKAVLQEG